MLKQISIGIAACALSACCAAAQGTTYVQTTHGCTTTLCDNAQLAGNYMAAYLSYGAHFETCGQKDVSGFAIWNGTQYEDLKVSMVWLGYTYKGKNYYPDGIWQVQGTFNNGTISLTETFRTYRGCSGYNLDGQVVTP